ncbi:hypothetical protein ACT7PJ_000589 [Salmonella enterica subsp. enterica serovar Enteritidis]
MNKKHTNHHLLKINDIKTESYNMMMMHEKSKMRQIPRRCRPVADRPVADRPAGSTFLKYEQLSTTTT